MQHGGDLARVSACSCSLESSNNSISLGKVPIIWVLRTYSLVSCAATVLCKQLDRKKKKAEEIQAFHGNKEAKHSNKSNRQRYNWNPVWISATETIQNIIEWILILCSGAQRSTKAERGGMLFWQARASLLLLVLFIFTSVLAWAEISERSGVNSAGNQRGYFGILLSCRKRKKGE